MTTITQYPNGWLPYGSDDDSIIFQHDLKSDPTTYFQSIATLVTTGSSHEHDSTLGFCPNGDSGYRLQSMTGSSALDNAGQISVEVMSSWLCHTDATYETVGYIPAAAEAAMSYLPTAGSTGKIVMKETNGSMYSSGGLFAGLQNYTFSQGKSQFVTVNLGWSGGLVGGKCYLSIDGKTVDAATRNNAALSAAFALFYIGSDRGVASTYMTAGYYMRNLQISTRPPIFTAVPNVISIAMLTDSLLNSDDPLNGNYKDVVSSWTMRQFLAEKSIFPKTVTLPAGSTGGFRLDDSDAPNYLKDELPALLATNPTCVVIRGGTNDVAGGRCSQGTWQAAVSDYITDCFATPSVKIIVFANIPTLSNVPGTYPYATYGPEVTTGNLKIQAAADAWRTANPTDPRQIVVVDSYNQLGAETLPDGVFKSGDIHLSGYGHYLHGAGIARGIISVLD